MKKNTLVKVVRIDKPKSIFLVGRYKGIENNRIIVLDNETNNYTQFDKDVFKAVEITEEDKKLMIMVGD